MMIVYVNQKQNQNIVIKIVDVDILHIFMVKVNQMIILEQLYMNLIVYQKEV